MVIGIKKNNNCQTLQTARDTVVWQQLFWVLVLGLAYVLRDITKLPMPDIVFTGLCGMAFLLLPTGAAVGVYMFTTALTVPDFEIRLVYLAVLLAKFWIQKKKFKASVLLVTIGLALLELVNMTLFSTRVLASVLYDIGMRLTYFALPLFWFSEDHSREDYRRALLCYVGGVILGGAVMLWISVDAVGWKMLLEGTEMRLGANTADGYQTQSQIRTGYNANQLGGMFAIVIATVFAMMDRKYMSKIWGSLLVVFSAFMVVLTKSRTAILLVLGIVVAYCFILIFRRKKLLSGVLFLAAVAILAYGITALFPDAVEDLLARFQDESNRTGGRDELFTQYMSAWMENVWVFLFGYGIGSYSQMVNISNVPHNILTDILISWGLTGFLGIAYLLYAAYKQGSRGIDKNIKMLACLPALVGLVFTFGGQYLTVADPHMRLCFLLLAIRAFLPASEKEGVSL